VAEDFWSAFYLTIISCPAHSCCVLAQRVTVSFARHHWPMTSQLTDDLVFYSLASSHLAPHRLSMAVSVTKILHYIKKTMHFKWFWVLDGTITGMSYTGNRHVANLCTHLQHLQVCWVSFFCLRCMSYDRRMTDLLRSCAMYVNSSHGSDTDTEKWYYALHCTYVNVNVNLYSTSSQKRL